MLFRPRPDKIRKKTPVPLSSTGAGRQGRFGKAPRQNERTVTFEKVAAIVMTLTATCDKWLKSIPADRPPRIPPSPSARSPAEWVRAESEEIPIRAQFSPQGGNGAVIGISELERLRGVEPPYAAWEAAVLPMNYSRMSPLDKRYYTRPFLNLQPKKWRHVMNVLFFS